jgi:hypothetical protein
MENCENGKKVSAKYLGRLEKKVEKVWKFLYFSIFWGNPDGIELDKNL